ncbi:MAG: thioredoxin family protein, partial [Gammaproteobacteria bacterium]|nr:thioredoxin family protein [Gammaproteobacteria bacterium]
MALAGCDRRKKDEPPPTPEPQSTPAAAAEDHLPPGIDWFKGDVDAAFAAAKAANKPVFLYWSAEWCPPCAQIKTTIFA